MTAISSLNGMRVTLAFQTDRYRWQTVLDYLADAALAFADDILGDVLFWVTNDFNSAFSACMAVDTQIAGFQVEPLLRDTEIIPQRVNFASGSYPGVVSGDSTPIQTSQLIAFYSEDQIAAAGRTIVGKSFVGPCPESQANGGIISDGQATLLAALGNALLEWDGNETSHHYTRALGPQLPLGTPRPGAADYYACDAFSVRHELFTQRRRMRPII